MDISSISSIDTAEFWPINPMTDERIGIMFVLAGPEHPTRRALNLDLQRAARKRVNKAGGRLQLEEDPEVDQDRQLQFVASCVLDWKDLDYQGQALPHSAVNARMLLEDKSLRWLRLQIEEALAKETLFTKSSPGVWSRTPSTASA